MIKEGCLKDVDEVYGMHNYAFAKIGKVVVRPGSFMAECLDFKVTFIGVGGHITTPELCIDPL